MVVEHGLAGERKAGKQRLGNDDGPDLVVVVAEPPMTAGSSLEWNFKLRLKPVASPSPFTPMGAAPGPINGR